MGWRTPSRAVTYFLTRIGLSKRELAGEVIRKSTPELCLGEVSKFGVILAFGRVGISSEE